MKGPIKYFGGKGTMFNRILAHFPKQDCYDTYVEPFGGGASILFAKEPSKIEIYNDLEENVYSLFKVLSNNDLYQEFKKLCDLSFYSRKLRDEYKEELKEDNLSLLDRAYKFYYVNRSSVNGIGGFTATSIVRRNMSKSVSDFLSSIDRMSDIHNRLSSCIIENIDGLELLKKWDKSNVFAYLDPPYHHSTRTNARYKCDMDNNQHKELVDFLIETNIKVLLSGYDNPIYDKLVDNGWNKINFEVKTVDGNRNKKTKIETLWFNYNLNEK